MRKRGIILLLVTMLLLSCSPKALREAEEVVAQADSMRAAGQMYGIYLYRYEQDGRVWTEKRLIQ